jgi:hypothetical protein
VGAVLFAKTTLAEQSVLDAADGLLLHIPTLVCIVLQTVEHFCNRKTGALWTLPFMAPSMLK